MRKRPRETDKQPAPSSRAQEVLDIAFARAAKVTSSGKSRLERARSLTGRKIGRSSGSLLRQLALARAPFRDREGAFNDFTEKILAARLGPGAVEHALHRIHVAEERILTFRTEATRSLSRSGDVVQAKEAMRRFYGRASSVIQEVEADLSLLEVAKSMMRSSPHLEAGTSTVTVVGYPNVGKSSLVGKLSSASPKVAPYPFTTLQVSLGHAEIGPTLRTQVIDTPGLVEGAGALQKAWAQRSGISELNVVEREAMTAVEATSGVVLFLLDPTGTCGWSVDEQTALLHRLRSAHPTRPFLVVENKVDLARLANDHLKVSCVTGEGIPELLAALEKLLGGSPRRAPRPALR